jgi:cation-transporting ATPase 13A3/4/5
MNFSFAEMNPPPLGPPSRQQIYIEDDDSTIRLVGYEVVPWRQWVWRLGCLITLGILGLLGHWFPRLWIRFVAHEKAFRDINGGFVVVERYRLD